MGVVEAGSGVGVGEAVDIQGEAAVLLPILVAALRHISAVVLRRILEAVPLPSILVVVLPHISAPVLRRTLEVVEFPHILAEALRLILAVGALRRTLAAPRVRAAVLHRLYILVERFMGVLESAIAPRRSVIFLHRSTARAGRSAVGRMLVPALSLVVPAISVVPGRIPAEPGRDLAVAAVVVLPEAVPAAARIPRRFMPRGLGRSRNIP